MLLGSSFSAHAQYTELDRASEKLAQRTRHEHMLMIAVADFASPDGVPQPLGHAFAGFVSLALQNDRSKLPVLDHDAFDKEAQEAGISIQQISSSILTAQPAWELPEDVLVVGSIRKTTRQYQIELSAIRLHGLKKLASETVSFPTTDFLESLSAPFPPKLTAPVLRGGANGVGATACVYCPAPPYSDIARKYKVRGTIVLDVVVDVNGRAIAARPVRLLGAGLDEQAVRAIKSWKFRPATNAEGQPVTVIVPIEVTFRIY
jgi:TonB family protein